jgi:hypothetical protein
MLETKSGPGKNPLAFLFLFQKNECNEIMHLKLSLSLKRKQKEKRKTRKADEM